MSDQIETLLSRYFAKLRPNPPMPAEARLIAALDAADAERSPVWRFGAGRGSRALAGGMAALAVIAIAGSLALRGMNGGGSQAGGAGANKSQQAGGTPSESQMASGTAAATGPTPLSSGSPAHSAGASSAAPGTPGTFTVTGTMTTVDNGMATLLLDGRVLIVGSAADSPEIYDPETGQFSKTGEGIKGGDFGSATRLADGRVLFVGGNDDHTTFSTAQIYDPATGKFTATGSLHQGRTGHTATLLADGRVLIAGGDTFNYAAQPLVIAAAYHPGTAGQGKNPRTSTGPDMLASAEIYDPKTGKFSPTGSMTTGRSYAGAELLPNGRVLIAGGGNEGNAAMDSAELYDPKTGKFTLTGSMPSARYAFNTTRLADGRVIVTSGTDGTGQVNSIDAYDPKTGEFSRIGSEGAEVFSATALLHDGRLLLVGSYDITQGKGGYLAICAIFDPSTGKVTPTGSMNTPRLVGIATTLLDGRVLVAGGVGSGDPGDLASAELYQP